MSDRQQCTCVNPDDAKVWCPLHGDRRARLIEIAARACEAWIIDPDDPLATDAVQRCPAIVDAILAALALRVGDGTPGPARTNAPEFPKYEGYDGPRIVQRLDYAADVLDLLAEWIGAKPSLPHRDLIQLAKDFRSMADEDLEELWPQ